MQDRSEDKARRIGCRTAFRRSRPIKTMANVDKYRLKTYVNIPFKRKMKRILAVENEKQVLHKASFSTANNTC